MKDTKRRLEMLSLYDPTGIAAHLEAMAQKGWALEKISNALWTYRRIRPRRLHYAAVYLPSTSEFDPGPNEESRQMQDFCARAGWVHVASLAQMHIFCNEEENPIPIETEPSVQVDTIHRAMKKNFLPSQITLLVLAVLQLAMQLWQYTTDPLSWLSSGASLTGCGCWILVIAMTSHDITKYYAWRKKALLAARDGVFLPTKGSQVFQYICLGILGLVMVLWCGSLSGEFEAAAIAVSFGFMGLLFFAVFAVKNLFKKKRASAGTSRAAVWVTSFVMAFLFAGGMIFFAIQAADQGWFEEDVETYEFHGTTLTVHHDELPLYLEDLMETDYTGYSTALNTQRSILLTWQNASQSARLTDSSQPVLGYNIYDVHFAPLEDLVRREITADYTEDEIWGISEFHTLNAGIDGVEVWQLYRDGETWNTLLLCYGQRFVLLHPGWELTLEQIRTAAALLAP